MKIFLNNKVNLMAGAQQVILFHLFEILFMMACLQVKESLFKLMKYKEHNFRILKLHK
jgi:hypothetical protein